MMLKLKNALMFLGLTAGICLSDGQAETLNDLDGPKPFWKFRNPQAVEINGLPLGAGGTPISTEEPFISRDGRFLFF